MAWRFGKKLENPCDICGEQEAQIWMGEKHPCPTCQYKIENAMIQQNEERKKNNYNGGQYKADPID